MTKLEQFRNRFNDIKRCSHPQMRKKRAEVLMKDLLRVYEDEGASELINLYMEVERV